MQNHLNRSRWMSTVVRLWFGCAAFSAVSMTAQAQTYYYYPTSVPAAPSVAPGANFATTRVRCKELYATRSSGTAIRLSIIRLRIRHKTHRQLLRPSILNQRIRLRAFKRPSANQVAPTTTSNAAPVATAAASTEAGDPYGFLGWLNATRASYGLPAVGYDANLSNWAAMNNDQQAARGMGHFVMGPARRQNSAMGAFANIGSMWMNSPAHRAALLDPTITAIGIAGLGAYWTFNAY